MNLTPWILLPGIGKIVIALAFILFARQRGGSWRYLGIGALMWIVTVAVKFLVATPLNPLVYQMLGVSDALFSSGNVLFYVYVGVLTGLTEVLISWLPLRYTRLGRVSWVNALAFGIGFGAFEALYLGVPSLFTNLSLLAAPQSISTETLSSLQILNNPLYSLAPATDRIPATLVHIIGNVLLFYSVASKQVRWVWVSFGIKSMVDTIAAFGILYGTPSIAVLWMLEAVLWLIGAASFWGVLQIHRRYILVQKTQPIYQVDPLN